MRLKIKEYSKDQILYETEFTMTEAFYGIRENRLKGIAFAQSHIDEKFFVKADLRDMDLSGYILNGAIMIEADITNANFDRADLSGSVFKGANGSGANFEGANLTGVDFEGADLTGANFRGAILIGANFKNAILKNANFENAKMSGVKFEASFVSRQNLARSGLNR